MIQLTDKIIVSADRNQYIVGTPRQTKDKGAHDSESDIRICNPRYYSTLSSALKGAVAQALRDGVADETITSLRDFIMVQERLQNEFDKLLKPLDI